jgi:hypothetical protein
LLKRKLLQTQVHCWVLFEVSALLVLFCFFFWTAMCTFLYRCTRTQKTKDRSFYFYHKHMYINNTNLELPGVLWLFYL